MPTSAQFYGSACPIRKRAEWAAAPAASEGCYRAQGAQGVTVVCAPALGAAVLRRHDGGAGGLSKPDKGRSGPIGELLQHSLTNSAPGEWPRQRVACKAALGSVGKLGRQSDGPARAAAAATAAELLPAGERRREVDLKPPIYATAAAVLALAVVGAAHADEVQAALVDLWRHGRVAVVPPLHHRRGEPGRSRQGAVAAAARLRAAVLAAATAAAAAAAAGREVEDSAPLLAKLLAQEQLSAAEAESNVHSFLLAGFETTAIVALFALLHLAHDAECQAQCAEEAEAGSDAPSVVVQAVVQETLRMYPPVLSLPRIVKDPAGLQIDGVGHVPSGAHVTVCSAAASFLRWPDPHRWLPARHVKADSSDEDEESVEEGEARPTVLAFGVGPRSCPAGSLAVCIARTVIETVLRELILSPPERRPVDGLVATQRCCWPSRQDSGPRYYWESRLVQTPVLLLTGAATVVVTRRGEAHVKASRP